MRTLAVGLVLLTCAAVEASGQTNEGSIRGYIRDEQMPCVARVLTLRGAVAALVTVIATAQEMPGIVPSAPSAASSAGLPRVIIETELGDIEAEVDIVRAPKTAANFLRYVEGHYYDGGRFFRTVRPDNQPTDTYKIQVVQVSANADVVTAKPAFPPIPLERTRDTGLRHVDGSLSMARSGPDTATHSFSIVLDEQPSMDCGGLRNADGQGFAVFGRVLRGLEVARQIQAQPADGQRWSHRSRS